MGSAGDGASDRGRRSRPPPEPYDLLLFGNESADAGNYQVPIRVAQALGLPCVGGIKGISVADGSLRCEQEVPGGRDVYELPMPAVVTVKEGINLPRYPSVPGRMRAKRKPLVGLRAARAGGQASDGPPGASARAPSKQAEVLGHGPRPRPRWSRSCKRSG